MDKNLFILTVRNLKGIGNEYTKRILFNKFNDIFEPKDIYHALVESIGIKGYPKKEYELEDIINSYHFAQKTLDLCDQLEIKIVNIDDNTYPKKLLELDTAPVILFYRGKIEKLNTNAAIALIGTREPSKYGEEIAKLYAKYLSSREVVVVSGLANGIDSIGHAGCLSNNGCTIAFIAQGLNTPIYPKESRDLAEHIVSQGGAIVSEYLPNEKPNMNYFVQRDRLQSGASDAVLVIETDITGGSMHAVKTILSLNRNLGVLDHPEKFRINNKKSLGNQYLILEKNAVPILDESSLKNFVDLAVSNHQKVITSPQKESHVEKTNGETTNSEQLSIFESKLG